MFKRRELSDEELYALIPGRAEDWLAEGEKPIPNLEELNPNITRINKVDEVRSAYIMFKEFPVAKISKETCYTSDEFDWVIEPYYDIMQQCWEKYGDYGPRRFFITGIDLAVHKKEYIRRYTPAFVTQRTIPECRPDLVYWMRKLKMFEYDDFEYLCRSHGVCGNDIFYVSRTPDLVIDPRGKFDYDIPEKDKILFERLNLKEWTALEFYGDILQQILMQKSPALPEVVDKNLYIYLYGEEGADKWFPSDNK